MNKNADCCTDCENVKKVLGEIPSFKCHSFQHVRSTGSTNDDLKADWKILPPPKRILLADHQQNGRGQFGRKWENQPGGSLLFSFSWIQELDDSYSVPWPLVTGVALHKAISGAIPNQIEPWLKWPNDLYINESKVAGVLIETTHWNNHLCAVIGVGVNLKFSENWRPSVEKAIDLASLGKIFKPPELLEAILRAWSELAESSQNDTSFSQKLFHEFSKRSKPFWNKVIQVELGNGEKFIGKPKKLDEKGSLVIMKENLSLETLTSVFQISII
ncbi:biotin--[acetyl-CoA-carboxylase] ligase [bacterium]|nr:biotin--[acetyl-CoA-carboxylase] ligase [bacterium]